MIQPGDFLLVPAELYVTNDSQLGNEMRISHVETAVKIDFGKKKGWSPTMHVVCANYNKVCLQHRNIRAKSIT